MTSEEPKAAYGNHRLGEGSEVDAQFVVDTYLAWCAGTSCKRHRSEQVETPF